MTKFDRFNEAYDYLVWQKIVKTQSDVAKAMGSTQANVSLALNGTRLSNKFISRFCDVYGIFNYSYIITGEGQLLAEQAQKRPESYDPGQTAKDNEFQAEQSIIELAASLIKENEALRRDLKQAINEVRLLRNEMSHDRDVLSTLRASLSKLLYKTTTFSSIPMAAENQENQN